MHMHSNMSLGFQNRPCILMEAQVHADLSSWPLMSFRLMQGYVRPTELLHAALF